MRLKRETKRMFSSYEEIMKFDDIYNGQIETLEEGKFKSIVMAGMLAAGLPATSQGAKMEPNRVVQTQAVTKQATDSNILSSIIDFTANAEGFSNTVYKCSRGINTIGYGTSLQEPHNIVKLKQLGYNINALNSKKQQISREDAKKLLIAGLEQAIKDARTYLPNFDSQPLHVKAVLTDMSYNLGLTKLKKFEGLREGLMKKDYTLAKKHMINSHWYKQVGNRSKRLVKMMDGANNT